MKQEAARVAQMILSKPEVPEDTREAARGCAGLAVERELTTDANSAARAHSQNSKG